MRRGFAIAESAERMDEPAQYRVGSITLSEEFPGVWTIPPGQPGAVSARLIADRAALPTFGDDRTLDQLKGAAALPAMIEPVVCLPDGHQGYGFPVGGVGASPLSDGIISPGAVGYDINCGVRLLRTSLTEAELEESAAELTDALAANIPAGMGGDGVIRLDAESLEAILESGIGWAVEAGYATADDEVHCEDGGVHPAADPAAVSTTAQDRGRTQAGSLGSGNHFLEVQVVDEVFDADVASRFGITSDQVVVMIHCGSRGLGHQVCRDYLDAIAEAPDTVVDGDLAAVRIDSDIGQAYHGAMAAAVNYAWVNRQLLTHQVRQVFGKVFGRSWRSLGMELVYDVAHNIAKVEDHRVHQSPSGLQLSPPGEGGESIPLMVHRKGATRAFPSGHPAVPETYREVGQPVLLPGSMGTASYVLVGGSASMGLTFGSTAHGAGRRLSRTAARNKYDGSSLRSSLLSEQGIHIAATTDATIAEEAPGVYKDVDAVVASSDAVGIASPVARCRPVCNVKG